MAVQVLSFAAIRDVVFSFGWCQFSQVYAVCVEGMPSQMYRRIT